MRMRTEIQRLTKKREASRWKNRKEEPAGRCSADFFARKVCRAFCLAGCLSLLLLSGCGKESSGDGFPQGFAPFLNGGRAGAPLRH